MFMEKLEVEINSAYTENGAKVHSTTGSELVDFFAQGGAMRGQTEENILNLFFKAYRENKIKAIQMLFYFRDVRGGQGERRLFRVVMSRLAETDPEYVRKILALVPEYGRWEDVYCFVGTPVEDDMWNLVAAQLDEDIKNRCEGKPISLLAKWLKSERTHGKSNYLGKRTLYALGLHPATYRKILSDLRGYLKVVEKYMSNGQWEGIEFEDVPSQAMMKYYKAFQRNLPEKFEDYKRKLASGQAKINAATLYPYQIYQQTKSNIVPDVEILDQMWNSLPNYLQSATSDALVVADVSGSMTWTGQPVEPIDISVSLAAYIAERLPENSPYKDKFITFSADPKLQKITGENIVDKFENIENAEWGGNTDLSKVFRLILQTAVKHQIPKEEMIKRLVVISDMEFDAGTSSDWRYEVEDFLMEELQKEFAYHEYQLPKVVWWNVDARNTHFPMRQEEKCLMVSGASPAIMSAVLNDELITPMDLIEEILNRERYKIIKDNLQKT